MITGFVHSSYYYINIPRAERYVKQLNSHLSKKASYQEGFLLFPDLGAAEASVVPGSTEVIRLMAYSDDEENLKKIQNILTKHLFKFAKIDEDKVDSEWRHNARNYR